MDEVDGADCWIVGADGRDFGSANAARKNPMTSGTSGNLLKHFRRMKNI